MKPLGERGLMGVRWAIQCWRYSSLCVLVGNPCTRQTYCFANTTGTDIHIHTSRTHA
jgi:hypothetical protein